MFLFSSLGIEIQTTRLKSTAGAGVASMLMDEASFLNPAPIAFYDISSFYASRIVSTTTVDENESIHSQDNSNLGPLGKGKSLMIVASDAKGPLKGSLSFVQTKENDTKYQQWAMALAAPIAPQSSLGLWGRRISTTELKNYSKEKPLYQMAIGAYHAIDSQLSFGLVFIDPLKSSQDAKDSCLQLGGQYLFRELVSLILDIGGNPYKNIQDKNFYKAAIQLKVFTDLYFRAGIFKDRTKNESGSGLGGGWLTPKLNIEGALRNVQEDRQTTKINRKEVSFSLSYRF